MKIAFVFPPMWSPCSDGSLSIWNQEVTTRLSKHSDVLVYSGAFDFERADAVNGVRYRRFSTHWDSRIVKYFRLTQNVLRIRRATFGSDLWWPGYAWKVALDLRKQGCDIAHVYYYPQFANLIKRLNPTLPVILHMHGEWLTQVKFTNLRERLRRIDMIVSCSELCTKSIRAMFPQIASRCRTLAMGMSPDDLSRVRREMHADNVQPRRLLYVGRISPEKGIHVLLDAFELISQRYPDASLTIVGPEWISPPEDITNLCLDRDAIASLAPFYKGSYLSQLKQKLSPDAAMRVRFVGLVAHRDVPQYYGRADIYVNPSYYESFGVSILEAMAAGVPVVAAEGGAVTELISDGHSGLIVKAGSPSAIADAVIKLVTNPSLRQSISRVARETVWKRFSWETICSVLMQMYRELLTATPSIASEAL